MHYLFEKDSGGLEVIDYDILYFMFIFRIIKMSTATKESKPRKQRRNETTRLKFLGAQAPLTFVHVIN